MVAKLLDVQVVLQKTAFIDNWSSFESKSVGWGGIHPTQEATIAHGIRNYPIHHRMALFIYFFVQSVTVYKSIPYKGKRLSKVCFCNGILSQIVVQTAISYCPLFLSL